MYYPQNTEEEEFRPRMIVWQLTRPRSAPASGEETLGSHECMLVLEGIAKIARPIVIFTGEHITERKDLFDIVQYGSALGLKMIVEVETADLTDDMLRKFAEFGPKTFRLQIGNTVRQGQDSRYEVTPEFRKLEERVKQLKKAGFELHLTVNIAEPDEHQLAVHHDFAFRHAAAGFYCHLAFGPNAGQHPRTEGAGSNGDSADAVNPIGAGETIESYLESMARLKQYSPDQMFFSPQCVKYGYRTPADIDGEEIAAGPGETVSEWRHWCLGGKTFAYISPEGHVQLCAGINIPCGSLRRNSYDFKSIWEESPTFKAAREKVRTCPETRDEQLGEPQEIPGRKSS